MYENKGDFETFISKLTETNTTLDFFTDFEKCYHNLQKIEIKLNTLNYLIGKVDLKKAVSALEVQSKDI